jgi:hypothetical protein
VDPQQQMFFCTVLVADSSKQEQKLFINIIQFTEPIRSKSGLVQDPGKEKQNNWRAGGFTCRLASLRGQKKKFFIQKYEFFPTLNLSNFSQKTLVWIRIKQRIRVLIQNAVPDADPGRQK